MDCAALLGGPLLRAAHALVLTRTPAAPAAAAAAAGKQGCRKGGRGGLHASAVAAVAALLALCRSREALCAALGGAAEALAAQQVAGIKPRRTCFANAWTMQALHNPPPCNHSSSQQTQPWHAGRCQVYGYAAGLCSNGLIISCGCCAGGPGQQGPVRAPAAAAPHAVAFA